MTTYLDLMPDEINDIIMNFVLESYQKQHKITHNIAMNEIQCCWLYCLWGAGYNSGAIVDTIYRDKKFIVTSDINKNLISHIRDAEGLTYIKPSFLKHIIRLNKAASL